MFPVIPDKLLFCKRLAQCCNPVLPPGVHLKTLETYEIVFERIGVRTFSAKKKKPAKNSASNPFPPQKDRLAKDLPFYSSGLFPLFAYASMQVKVRILSHQN